MVLMNGDERMKCEVYDGIRLEHVSEFKYFGYVLDESGTDGDRVQQEGGEWEEGCRCHQVPSYCQGFAA